MYLRKRNLHSWLLMAILFGLFNSLIAQPTEAPAWLRHIAREEIIMPEYIESQKVLDPYSISTVEITMDPADYIKLINDINSDEYLMAEMTYESPTIPRQTIDSVGIRLRGAAARSTSKKSFKISFRAFDYDDREFYNLRQLNLNCDFQDPHLMRAKTSTDMFRLMGVDAARVAYAELYINGDYRGLFANSEDIGKAFLDTRFDDNNGDLYKCDGASMQVNSGGYNLTTNELTSDNSDIHEFIQVLNNTGVENYKEEIEKVFDVDEMLMYVASNVLLGAWDDYWVLAKNYYLYHDVRTDQFNYIPHDFDGSLGTDWYHGNVAYGNVYTWSPNSGRPMVENLLAIPEYRDRYTHYLMLLCMWPFSLEAMEPEIDRTADMIRSTLTNDPYWGWNPSDFDLAFDQAISQGNVKYGMKEYINLRQNSALEQLDKIGPFIKPINRYPLLPDETDPVTISQLVVDIANVNNVKLVYSTGVSSGVLEMLDNGAGLDKEAGDFIFTAQIPAFTNTDEVLYYVEATNGEGRTSRYPAAYEWESYSINYESPIVFINEILAKNDSIKKDENGEYDDWFELYNPGDELVDLFGMYVSDNILEPRKWRLGNISIPAKGFTLLWADDDPEQGPNHLGFNLSSDGEILGLYDRDEYQNSPIDVQQFGPQMADISYGRTEDGALEWIYFDEPTPGYGNRDTSISLDNLIDITDFGGSITESNNNSPGGETVVNIIDNNLQTKYLTLQESTWIQYSHTDYSQVFGYAIVSANDVSERDPSNWEFQAYDEDIGSWVTLHTVTSEPVWPSRFLSKEFTFTNPKRYKSYRLDISSAHGVGIVQLAELEIYGEFASGPTKVEKIGTSTFSIYPNPAHNVLTITSNTELKTVQLYDVSGRMLKQYTLIGDSSNTLNISELKNGIYILRTESVGGEFNTTKFIKN